MIQNKCLIKGELAVKTLYCADTNENELETIEHTMPISQIVEVDGIDEDCGSDIRLEVMGWRSRRNPIPPGSCGCSI